MRPRPCLPTSYFLLDTLDVYIKRHNGSSAPLPNPLRVNGLNVMRNMVFKPPQDGPLKRMILGSTIFPRQPLLRSTHVNRR